MASNEKTTESQDAVTIGRALRRYSEAAGLNQTDLAKALGTSQPTVSRLLRGKQRAHPALMIRITKVLGPSWSIHEAGTDEWIKKMVEAAKTSPAFHDLIVAALSLMNKNE